MTRAVLALLLVAGSALAREELRSDIKQPDFNQALDVVIVGDGWEWKDREDFFSLAKEKLGQRIRSEVAAKPMRDGSAFNFHYLFVSSEVSGVPWRPGYPARKTAFRSRVDAEGTMLSDDAAADAIANRLAPDVDLVVILVKLLKRQESITTKELDRLRHMKKKWRPETPSPDADVSSPDDVRPNADIPGDGGRIRITTVDTEAFIHEVGHASYGLGDEYDELDGEIPEEEKFDIALTPNLTCDPSGARWRHILADPPVQGGGTWQRGVWRPQKHCRMLESRSRNFCAVCAAAIRGTFAAPLPANPTITAPSEGATIVAPRVSAQLHQLEIPVAWRDGTGGAAPYSFHVVLRRESTGRRVWSNDVEGHLRRATISMRVKSGGSYLIGVRADGPGGRRSEYAWRRIEVELGGPASGILGAIDGD